MALHARLFDGASVEHDIQAQLYNLTYNSLLDSGPPAGFQIDGNFGGTAAIAEALLQSHNGMLTILPALPPSSKNGRFTGLVARGGFVVDAVWSDGKLVNATVESGLGVDLKIALGTGQNITMQGGDEKARMLSVKTTKGSKYVFTAA
jgi:alpha-L-fucosidase 2